MRPNWSPATKYTAGIAVVVLGIYTLYLSSSVIPLLIIAALLAVMVRPIINWLQQRFRCSLSLAVTLAYLVVAFIVPVVVVLLLPALVDAFRYILSIDYSRIAQQSVTWIYDTLTALKDVPIPNSTLNQTVDRTVDATINELQGFLQTTSIEMPAVSTILQSLQSALTTTFGAAAGLIGNLFSVIILIIFIFLASMYMSLEAHTYRHTLLNLVPSAYQGEMDQLFTRIGQTWNAFFRGQITLMIIIGLFSWIGLTILGVPGAISLAIVAGVLEIIPNLGPVIATIPAVIVALLQGSTYLDISPAWLALLVAAFYLLLQQLENSIIVPRVLGDAVGLSPLVVMTGVLVGTVAAGILGALLATPVIATGYEILRYVYAKMNDADPFPPASITPPPVPIRQLIAGYAQRIQYWWQHRD
jgi:predicted PurR-regulated permease PerM